MAKEGTGKQFAPSRDAKAIGAPQSTPGIVMTERLKVPKPCRASKV